MIGWHVGPTYEEWVTVWGMQIHTYRKSLQAFLINLTDPAGAELHQMSLTAAVTPPAPLPSSVRVLPLFRVDPQVRYSCGRALRSVYSVKMFLIMRLLQFLLFSFVSVITNTPGLWEMSNCLSSCITLVSPKTLQVMIVTIVTDSAGLPGCGALLA